jgi:hypothetical protein
MPSVVIDPSSSTGPFVTPAPEKTPLEIVKDRLDKALSETKRKLGKEAEGTMPEIAETRWEDIEADFVLQAYQTEELNILKTQGTTAPNDPLRLRFF